uniref:Uncharacterized protein n=1 Tax=Arundo donax TaxID=35708 RepID=A0A0A8Y750_ARUDO
MIPIVDQTEASRINACMPQRLKRDNAKASDTMPSKGAWRETSSSMEIFDAWSRIFIRVSLMITISC